MARRIDAVGRTAAVSFGDPSFRIWLFIGVAVLAWTLVDATQAFAAEVKLQGVDMLIDTVIYYASGKIGKAIAFCVALAGALAAAGGHWGRFIGAIILAGVIAFLPGILESLWSAGGAGGGMK